MSLLCRRGLTVTVAVLALLVEQDARAQNQTYVGASANFTAGSANNRRTARAMKPFYSMHPSIYVTSEAERSAFQGSYSFGMERFFTDQSFTLQSHAAEAALTKTLAPKLAINLSNSFVRTTNTATFTSMRGGTLAVEDLPFVFDPVAAGLMTRTNAASAQVTYTFSETKALSVAGAHTLRHHERNDLFRESLSDQQRFSGTLAYSYKTGPRESWTLGYSAGYADFADFRDAVSYGIQGGYSNTIGRDLDFNVTVGATRVKNSAASYTGYATSASLQKMIEGNSFGYRYVQTVGRPSGLGSVSDTRRAGVSLRRDFIQAVLSLDISAFDARGRLDNTHDARGVAATASIGIPITSKLAFLGGGEYQRHTRTSAFAFTQERIFVSFQYTEPNLWRFSR